MQLFRIFLMLFLCSFVPCLAGCATVMSGDATSVAIRSNPPGAHVQVYNKSGQLVARGMTPTQVPLKRGNGLFGGVPHYTAVIAKHGYKPARVRIRPRINPWILGNVALGGVVGLAADSATGAIWSYTPTHIERELFPLGGPLSNPSYANGPRNGNTSQVVFIEG